ncbi:hypothetical protein [Streptomyces aureus]|uniref:hypothetical protein n=1 Tax=Streptomyces aureus TaxID=193461 RepID=UPI0006E2B506|nr:hypothetical protein [Streptomyces aureus]
MTAKSATTAAALVGGYLLGRTKKARLAIGVGMFLAGRRLDLDPRRIGKLLAASPVTGALSEQVRRELFEATKSAAAQALTKRASGLADSLQQRTRALGSDEAEEPEEREEPGDGAGGGGRQRARPAASAKSSAAKSTARKATRSTARKSTGRSSSRDDSSADSPRRAPAAGKRASAPRKTSASRARRSRSDNDE